MLSDIVRASPEDVRHMFDALETVAALPQGRLEITASL